jgi:site-specific DNA-methyltransferase (adenine-specific)
MAEQPFYTDPRVTLYHGDALAVLTTLPAGCADAVVTDPPYSSGGLYRGDRAGASTAAKYTDLGRAHHLPDFAGDSRDQRGYGYWCTLWLAEALRVARPGAVLAMFTDWRQLPLVTDVVQAGGWTWRGILAWAKPDARPQSGRPRNACEFVVWATCGPRTLDGDCLPGWWLTTAPRHRHHQTEKPLPVLRDLVRLCPPGGTVLDPFAGSGTTGIAALAERRRFLGVELSAVHVQVAADRLRRAALRPSGLDEQPPLDLEAVDAGA